MKRSLSFVPIFAVAVFVVLVVIIPFSSGQTSSESSNFNVGGINSSPEWKSKLHLFERALHPTRIPNPSHNDPENLKQIETIRDQMSVLYERLALEGQALRALVRKREQAKGGSWKWYFEREKRDRYNSVQREINREYRKIEVIIEEIDAKWHAIKPYFGVFSWLFAYEMLSFVPYVFEITWRCLEMLLIIDLLTIFVAAPLGILFLFFFLSMGLQFFFSILNISFFLTSLYWVFHLPSIIIQYNPTLIEFVMVYVPYVLFFTLYSAWFFGYFSNKREYVSIANEPRAKNKVAKRD